MISIKETKLYIGNIFKALKTIFKMDLNLLHTIMILKHNLNLIKLKNQTLG